jgi:hypothetical protein
MRKTYHAQLPLTSLGSHPRGAELCVMSAVFDAHSEILRWVLAIVGGCCQERPSGWRLAPWPDWLSSSFQAHWVAT